MLEHVATIASIVDDASAMGLDACTLNNALNIAQLVVLTGLLRWVRR